MTVHPLDYHDASRARDEAKKRRTEAREAYQEALEEAADAKKEYRKAKAQAHVRAAAEGGTAEQKKVRAEELAADDEHKMEMALAKVKWTKEAIDAEEGDRALVKSLIDWSARVNTFGGSEPSVRSPEGHVYGGRR